MLIFEAKMFTLIKNGSIVTPAETFISDLLIEDGMIREIGQDISCPVDEVIDASGLYVLPGGVDAHVPLRLMPQYFSCHQRYFPIKADHP